jgi:hypothetical protein
LIKLLLCARARPTSFPSSSELYRGSRVEILAAHSLHNRSIHPYGPCVITNKDHHRHHIYAVDCVEGTMTSEYENTDITSLEERRVSLAQSGVSARAMHACMGHAGSARAQFAPHTICTPSLEKCAWALSALAAVCCLGQPHVGTQCIGSRVLSWPGVGTQRIGSCVLSWPAMCVGTQCIGSCVLS